MIGIGFVLALLVGEYRAKKMGMKEEALIDIAIIAEYRDFSEQSCCI
jgi:phosphatidylglycerol:prolipoprotein diacylglycerol transferase